MVIDENPPYKWREIKVFISSTFRDFHAERDYLIKNVFPYIRLECQKWRLHFIDIDLRWGVTEEQAKSGKVVDLCLQQVEDCDFFIGLLGSRYGTPVREINIAKEIHKEYKKLVEKQDYSITHLEIYHAIFGSLSVKKDNTPPAFFYFRDTKCLKKPDEIQDFSMDERNQYRQAFFDCKPMLENKLQKLKKDITAHYKEYKSEKKNKYIYHYHPVFNPLLINPEDNALKGRFEAKSLSAFGEHIKKYLLEEIKNMFKQRTISLCEKQEKNSLENELDLHESFVENRTRLFIGRAELLKELKSYIESDSRKIKAVYGTTGSGKSSLLAQFYKTIKNRYQNHKETLIIPHFIGASPGSTALYTLLRRVCEEIDKTSLKKEKEQQSAQEQRIAIQKEHEIPVDINNLVETFEAFLNKTTWKVIILFDGLNQLDESRDAHDLTWLPAILPEKVKIIASTLPGKTEDAIRRKTDEYLTVPPLTVDDQRKIVKRIPTFFAKMMDNDQIDLLLKRKETNNPLYLKVAMDELRIFGSFEKLDEKIDSLPSDVVNLFEVVINRLAVENGKKIVEMLFCLLECSRYGLTLNELAELLAEDKDRAHLVILRQIRDYLFNREELIDFFHMSLSKAVRKKYFEEVVVE